ncbi:hypothetical protein ED312_07185 [Sinomicrobium pectinilyticum]|uniref:Uncharacterized protein n=1 Tax=Sinomicrobium pectinilyticum TaxID=1084421 RepID=A0A3N0EQD0_SINP1|nr:hypothetical protein [Sinomicrobium pectinilyticum]RNL89889.1 hypothetical protein ED312_07185 [Sinomicrobium pectinilyticum]
MIRTLFASEVEFQKKIERFRSTGALHKHPFLGFYYTEGVKYVMYDLFKTQKLLLRIAREASCLSETSFISIRMYGSCIEFRDRDGRVLQKRKEEEPVPIPRDTSFCLYWIGRTLLLPTEY